MRHHTSPNRPKLKLLSTFKVENPDVGPRMDWIRKRTKPVQFSRTDKTTGEKIVKDLKPNGFASCFWVLANRVYIDEDEFWRIVAEQNGRTRKGRRAARAR